MTNPYGISEAELNIIKQQAARRAAMRQEFLKQSTNPYKHAAQSGYVFDPAIQRFLSMKVTQLQFFQANTRTSLFGVCVIVLPMFALGYIVRRQRSQQEEKIRKGELVYRDRLFKFA